MIKYRFEVWYQTTQIKQVNDFINKLDLGIYSICLKETYAFNYTKDEKPISYFKDLINQAIESLGGSIVHIEGGKIE